MQGVGHLPLGKLAAFPQKFQPPPELFPVKIILQNRTSQSVLMNLYYKQYFFKFNIYSTSHFEQTINGICI